MTERSRNDQARGFGLGRATVGPEASTQERAGHPLAMVTDIGRRPATPPARTLPGVAPVTAPPA
jgi:hypothetical protein